VYSKAKIAGHPIHPTLVAFPVAFYTGTLAALAAYAANGHQFWLNAAIGLSIAGAAVAIFTALPGLVDLAFGIPRASQAKKVGVAHGMCNVLALGLFIAAAVSYVSH
jgi:uncharacterized membrane protein